MKKKKFIIPIIGVIVLLAMVGGAFAAWLLITPETTEVEMGNIKAEALNDQTFSLKPILPENSNLIFGRPADSENADANWFRFEDGTQVENLSVTLKLRLQPNSTDGNDINPNTYLNGRTITLTLSLIDNNTEIEGNQAVAAYEAALDYISYPSITVKGDEAKTFSSWDNISVTIPASKFNEQAADKTYIDAEVTITIAWGSKGNPFTYYTTGAGKDYSDANAKEAAKFLKALEALNDLQYKITLTASAPATQTPQGE